MSDMEERVRALESRVSGVEVKLATVEQAVLSNTEVTLAIKRDTASLVILFESSKLFAKIIAWTAGIGVSVVGLISYFKGLK